MDYYISIIGDDSNTGKSKNQPWRTVDKVNATTLRPGDTVRFHAHQIFNGNINFYNTDIPEESESITFCSYGDGKAAIDAGNGHGFYSKNSANVKIADLTFIGCGTDKNTSSGIYFVNTSPKDKKLKYVNIDNVEISGFRYAGICIAAKPIDGGWCGFSDVKITHANIHHNGDAGINCYGMWNPIQKNYSHRNIFVSKCRVFRNYGIREKESHTGNGIVLSQVDGATIEYCESFENGRQNDFDGGGPVGIWTWDSNRIVIQFNKSHHNHTGSSKDGGGFDLDGGVCNSIVQYNHSHDNDGAGYLLAQFDGAKEFYNNLIRFNLSVNDGRKNSYGGIHIWSTGANGGIRNTTIYRNKVITYKSYNANPAAVDCISDGIHNIRFYNNIFQTDRETVQIRGKTNPEVIFEGNTHITI